jgi:hypothetical protein
MFAAVNSFISVLLICFKYLSSAAALHARIRAHAHAHAHVAAHIAAQASSANLEYPAVLEALLKLWPRGLSSILR